MNRLNALLIVFALTLCGCSRDQQKHNVREDGNLLRARADMAALSAALDYYLSENGSPPSTEQSLHALVVKPTVEPVPENWRKYMKELPPDPWGNPYEYRRIEGKSQTEILVFSLGPDGKVGSDDILILERHGESTPENANR